MPKHRQRNQLEISRLTGLSQKELAAMLNTSRSTIAMHETTGRGLPDDATLYISCILMEMNKPENQAAIPAPALSEAAADKWKKELEWMAKEKRYLAEELRRKLEAYQQKETQRRNRLLLLPCVEKAQAFLRQQSNGTPWQPITQRHVQWLEMVKTFPSYNRFDESAHLQHLRDQLRYKLLVKELEEVERMISEL
jgi:transcriptional regulator with XRE-family HTH domain